jgi:hypothetical protein
MQRLKQMFSKCSSVQLNSARVTHTSEKTIFFILYARMHLTWNTLEWENITCVRGPERDHFQLISLLGQRLS